MKKKTKWIVGALLLMCLATSIFTACNNNNLQFASYEYDYTKSVEQFGDGIQIDGKLDESNWSGRKYLIADIKNTPVVYRMTSYFGEKGVYFAFDIADNAVFYNAEREIYANSGVEFCVGSPINTNITYEIDLNAGGKRMLRKYTGQPYTNWFSELHSAVSVQGEINTSSCTGYTAEIYLPYSLFNEDGSDAPLSSLLVNPAIIRANSASINASDSDRLWYSIGEQERGLGWAPAAPNWYSFNSDGLECFDIEFNTSANGSISGRPYLLSDEVYHLWVTPDDGYYLESLTDNGKDVTDKLTYTGGKAVYSFTGVGSTVLEAWFAPLSETKYTLSGTVAAENANLSQNTTLFAAYSGSVTHIAIDEDGGYSVELPSASYTLYCESDGYLTIRETANLNGNLTKNLLLRKQFLGAHNVIGNASNASSWDFSALGQGTAVSVDNGWLVATNHTTLMGTKMFVSGDIVLPMRSGVDRRAGFRFVDRSKNGILVNLFANNENSKNKYILEVIGLKNSDTETWAKAVELTDPVVRALAEGGGVPFAALYEAGKTSVWINGVKVLNEFFDTILLNAASEVVPGLVTCGGGVFHNLVFNTIGYENGYPVNISSGSGGTVSCDKYVYQANDTLTFTFAPDSGFALAEVTVNGDDKFAEINGNTFVLETRDLVGVFMTVRFVQIQGESGVLSGTVTVGGTPAPQVTLTLSNIAGETHSVKSTNGAFTFEAVDAGVWQLTVNDSAYRPFKQRIKIDGDKQVTVELIAITMEDKYVSSGGENYNVEAIESEKKVVYTGAGDGVLTTKLAAAANENIYVSTVVRKQDTFVMNDAGGLRYGLAFIGAGRTLNFNFAYFTNPGGYYADLVDWGVLDGKSTLMSENQVAAWESAAGLRIAAARINGTFYMFAEDNGVMKVMCSGAHQALSNAVINIGFGTWFQTVGAEYNEFDWTIGDVTLDVDVLPTTNGTVTVGANPILGEALTVTVKPYDGYLLTSLLVNGVEKLASLEEVGGAYVLTLPAYTATKNLTIQATFVEQGEFKVSLDVKLHKFGIGTDNLDFVADGASVELRGLKTYSENAVNGNVTYAAVEKGTYTVWVNGYKTASLIVSGEVDQMITLEYDLIETTSNIDTTDANNGNVTLNINSNDAVLFKQEVAANQDFYASAVFKNVDKDANSLRFGFYIWRDVDGNGEQNGGWDGEERIHAPICYQWLEGAREYVMQWIPSWSGYFMDDAAATAMAGDTGMRLGIARVGGTFFMLREVNGKIEIVSRFTRDTSQYANTAIRVGIVTMGSETTQKAKFSELQFETATTGTYGFNDSKFAIGLKGCAHYTNLMVVSDPVAGFKTDFNSAYQYQVDVDLSEFGETDGKLNWNNPSDETLYFKNSMTNLTLEYTLKADIPLRSRVTAFSVFDGTGPYVVSISHEANGDNTSNGYHVRLIRYWDWNDGVYMKISDAQMNKMKSSGLAMKIVRVGSTVTVYADDLSGGASVNLVQIAQRTYAATLGNVGCGIGVAGSGAMFSNIMLRNDL